MSVLHKNEGYVLKSKGYVGKNLFNKATYTDGNYVSLSNGGLLISSNYFVTDFMPVIPATQYVQNYASGLSTVGVVFYDYSKVFISGTQLNSTQTFTTPELCAYIRTAPRKTLGATIDNFQIELGSAATTYSPYSPSALNALSLVDRSRNQNNGTFSNVTWVQLPSGVWVQSFNGTTSYVEIPDSPTMRMTQGGTILCWVKANSLGEANEGRIIDKSSADYGVNGYCVFLSPSNKIYLTVDGSTNIAGSVTNAINFGTYYQVAITLSSTTKKIYINAVDKTLTGGSVITLPPNISGAVRIGNRAGATDRTFDGQIALLQMWNRVLSATEIARIFTSERGLFGV